MNTNRPLPRSLFTAAALTLALGGCTTTTTAPYTDGMRTIDLDPALRGPVAGIAIESQDIIGLTDRMMRDMLSVPGLASAANPPRVIIDAEHLRNDSDQRIDRNLITNRLRVGLSRAAAGRMVFVARHYARAVEQERSLKRAGVVDTATSPLVRAAAGADYRLGGFLSSQTMRDPRTGLVQRYTQITLEMFDLETGIQVWSDIYEIKRASADSIVYR